MSHPVNLHSLYSTFDLQSGDLEKCEKKIEKSAIMFPERSAFIAKNCGKWILAKWFIIMQFF